MRRVPLLAILLAGCGTAPEFATSGPYAIDVEAFDDDQRPRLRRVLDQPTAMVDLPLTEVKSRPEIYEFLLANLSFTAGVLRAQAKAKYRIWREDERSDIIDDGAGVLVRLTLFRRDGGRRVYYSYGSYDLGLFAVWCRTVIVMAYEERDGALWTQARIYAKIDGKFFEQGGKLLGLIEGAIRRRGLLFVDVASRVAEMAAEDPAALVESVKGSTEVDPAALEEFRRRFAD